MGRRDGNDAKQGYRAQGVQSMAGDLGVPRGGSGACLPA